LTRGVVEAEHGRAVERDLVHEAQEGLLDVREVAVGVEVLAVDVRDHGDGRRQLQERAVGLVGLRDHVLAAAQASARAQHAEPSPDHHRGIEPAPGRRAPPWSSAAATTAGVVAWRRAPAPATPYLRRMSSASISARGITGTPSRRASSTSGLSGFTAVEVTTTCAPSRCAASWP